MSDSIDPNTETNPLRNLVNSDGIRITWNQNDAAIPGVLEQIFEALERMQMKFQLLLEHNAAYYKGVVYVDSVEAVSLILDESADTSSAPRASALRAG